MRTRSFGVRLAAISLVGAFILPTAAPLVCEFRAYDESSAMDDMAGHESGPVAERAGTPTFSSSCMTVAYCVASGLQFPPGRVVLETPGVASSDADRQPRAILRHEPSAPPAPPPKA